VTALGNTGPRLLDGGVDLRVGRPAGCGPVLRVG